MLRCITKDNLWSFRFFTAESAEDTENGLFTEIRPDLHYIYAGFDFTHVFTYSINEDQDVKYSLLKLEVHIYAKIIYQRTLV